MGEDNLDLRTDPLFTVQIAGGETAMLSLASILARLEAGDSMVFSALQAHQRAPWHAFLVQLATMVLHRARGELGTHDEEFWRAGLVELGGSAEAFQLIVQDVSKPAFFQPPVPEGSLAALKETEPLPSDFDVLVTAKSHDVKGKRLGRSRPEHWAYALITLQTFEGFLGRGNYGVSRMNGGFGSRAMMALVPSTDPAHRFRRDVAVLLEDRDRIAGTVGYAQQGGHALLWTLPWDGSSSLALADCDPYFLEICRRVRLVRQRDGTIIGRRSATSAARVDAKALLGNLGDPWLPVSRDGKALTVSAGGFTYRLLHRVLLSGEFQAPACLKPRAGDPDPSFLHASVLVRGQGTTDGYHERTLPLPSAARRSLLSDELRQSAGALSKLRIDAVDAVQTRALHPALCALLQGGPPGGHLNLRDRRDQVFRDRHDSMVDAVFFDHLWADIDRDATQAAGDWTRLVVGFAEQILERAIDEVPIPLARRPRAIAAAESIFRGSVRHHFPDAFARSPNLDAQESHGRQA